MSTPINGRNRRRLALSGLFATAAAFGAWRMIPRHGPELVLELDQRNARAGTITNGSIYSLTRLDSEVVIECQDLATSENRAIARVDTSGTLVEQSALTDWSAHFIAVPHQSSSTPPRYISNGLRGDLAAKRPLGEFIFTDKPLGPDERRVVQTLIEPRIRGGKLHIVTLPDGKHSAPQIDTLGEPIQRVSKVLTPNALYWVRNKDRRYVTVHSSKGYRSEHPHTGDLMESPLDGSPARKVAHGVRYIAGGDSILWWERLRPYPDSASDLHYYIPETEEQGKILGFGTNAPAEYRHPVACVGRIYWLSAPERDGSSILYRANPAKTSPDPVMKMPPGSWVSPLSLAAEGRKLSVIFNSSKRSEVHRWHDEYFPFVAPESALREAVMIDPSAGKFIAKSGPITVLKASSLQVDQDFVYFITHEIRRDTFDFLSERDTSHGVTSLYRIRLKPVN